MAMIRRHPFSVKPAPDDENGESELGRLHLEECICQVITAGHIAHRPDCPVHGAHPLSDPLPRPTHAALFPDGCQEHCDACLIRVWLPEARAMLDGLTLKLPTIHHLRALDLHNRLVNGGR